MYQMLTLVPFFFQDQNYRHLVLKVKNQSALEECMQNNYILCPMCITKMTYVLKYGTIPNSMYRIFNIGGT